MRAFFWILVCLVVPLSVGAKTPVNSEKQGARSRATPFDRGRVSVAATLGAASYASGTYYLVGAGLGYFVANGLQLNANIEHWFGSGANDITKISPSVRYVLYQVPTLKPFVGVFYRHWFVHSEFINDADTLGARVGALFDRGGILLGIAGMYEVLLTDCDTNCGAWSPEVTMGLVF